MTMITPTCWCFSEWITEEISAPHGREHFVHPGFLWVQSQRAGLLRPGTRGIATPESTSRLDDLDQMNLFKMSGFLPSSEPAIGRSQELATVGWCRRTAELPLLVELERAACPQKSRKNRSSVAGRATMVVVCGYARSAGDRSCRGMVKRHEQGQIGTFSFCLPVGISSAAGCCQSCWSRAKAQRRKVRTEDSFLQQFIKYISTEFPSRGPALGLMPRVVELATLGAFCRMSAGMSQSSGERIGREKGRSKKCPEGFGHPFARIQW